MIEYHLEPLFSYSAILDSEIIGPVAEGMRINV